MSASERLATRAADLRGEFDREFSRPYGAETPPQLDVLVIQVASRAYGLQLADVIELHAGRTPVAVPSSRPGLLGLVGLRGVVVPVYDLSQALGHPPTTAPRWIAQVRASAPFAVAFELFERHVRLPLAELAPARPGAEPEPFVRASVRLEQYPLPVIDLPAIFESVTRRREAPERAKERR